MQPQNTRVRRKDGRRPTRRALEPAYYTPLPEALQQIEEKLAEDERHRRIGTLRHETVCTLYKLAQVQREVEAEMCWPLTPTDEIVAGLKSRLFGEPE